MEESDATDELSSQLAGLIICSYRVQLDGLLLRITTRFQISTTEFFVITLLNSLWAFSQQSKKSKKIPINFLIFEI